MGASISFLYTQLPWNFISEHHEGVVVQKDGILQRTFAYRAPDVDSAGAFEVNGLCLKVNDFTKRLGTGWAFFIEAQRFHTREYPAPESAGGSARGFDTLAPFLIDREREEAFRAAGKHFESSFFITFVWRPPSDSVKKLTSMFIQSAGSGKKDDGSKIMRENVEFFVNETNAIIGLLASHIFILPLDNEQTVAYLHSCVSMNRHYIKFPPTQIMLDRILPDMPLVNSLTMKLGDHYIPIIGINDFPEETYPAILDRLNRERMEYRWVSRYICLGKEETFNAFEAYKSMMAGQIYANYRAIPVMSYSLSHVLPLSSVWAGMRVNEHAGHVSGVDIPHLTCSTAEGTPFFLNINTTDVGHTAVWGPTGAGKSTLLNLLEAQFFKYPGSQVVVFDKGKSCRQICLACGGLFYEPAAENSGGVSFQPLRELETDTDMTNAMDFIESLFTVNEVAVTPPMRVAIKECLDLLREKHPHARTITSFIQYVNYLDPETKRPLFKEQLADYLWEGGKYGKIFDACTKGISLNTRFLAIEMEELMNRGEGAVVPALIYLFNLVEKKFKFNGNLTLLVLDEAWLFLKNETFSDKIAEWLKVLRKKNVFVLFATQDVADAFNSPLRTTIIQQCLTKIYLADPSALTAGMMPVYRGFGLTDSEISLIAASEMKRDYFYTSPLGRRKFQLDLGRLTLSLIGSPRHDILDALIQEHGAGIPLGRQILDAINIDYNQYITNTAPDDDEAARAVRAAEENGQDGFFWDEAPQAPLPPESAAAEDESVKAALILDSLTSTARRGKKGEGRLGEALAKQFGVSSTTVYQARKLLKSADAALITRVRSGELSIKKACRLLAPAPAASAPEAGQQAG